MIAELKSVKLHTNCIGGEGRGRQVGRDEYEDYIPSSSNIRITLVMFYFSSLFRKFPSRIFVQKSCGERGICSYENC